MELLKEAEKQSSSNAKSHDLQQGNDSLLLLETTMDVFEFSM